MDFPALDGRQAVRDGTAEVAGAKITRTGVHRERLTWHAENHSSPAFPGPLARDANRAPPTGARWPWKPARGQAWTRSRCWRISPGGRAIRSPA
jgi:hypothetical protein